MLKKARVAPVKYPVFRKAAAWMVLVFMLLFFAGCAGNYGYVQRSREVGRMFENLNIPSDYNYYFTGPEAVPYAIIGIHPDYNLKTRLWKSVNLTTEMLQMWLASGMQGAIGMPPGGSYILGPDGEKIGIWYSIFRYSPVKLVDNREVVVHPPTYFPGMDFRPMMERNAAYSPEKEKVKSRSGIEQGNKKEIDLAKSGSRLRMKMRIAD